MQSCDHDFGMFVTFAAALAYFPPLALPHMLIHEMSRLGCHPSQVPRLAWLVRLRKVANAAGKTWPGSRASCWASMMARRSSVRRSLRAHVWQHGNNGWESYSGHGMVHVHVQADAASGYNQAWSIPRCLPRKCMPAHRRNSSASTFLGFIPYFSLPHAPMVAPITVVCRAAGWHRANGVGGEQGSRQ